MLLLDTSVLIWVLQDLPRVGPRTRELLSGAGRVHASAVSFAEITIKSMTGKLTVPTDFRSAVRDSGCVELPVTAEDAEAMIRFPELSRHDPFDRLLVAQAATAGMSLLTADRLLLGLGHDFIVDATI